jgi:hypothetical protein
VKDDVIKKRYVENIGMFISYFYFIKNLMFDFYRCNELCCDRDLHVCEIVCGKMLNCGIQYAFKKKRQNYLFHTVSFLLVNVKNYVIKIFVENVPLIVMMN